MRWLKVTAAVVAVIALAWLASRRPGRARWDPPPAPTEPGALAPRP